MSEDAEILIVEDSITQAEQLKYILEQNRFKVITAYNGIKALEYLETNTPTLIISDIVMPEMNGYEMCERIKSNENLKNIPVILLTSLSDPQDVIKGLQAGADNFLTKPYNEEFLLSRVNYILLNQQLRKNLSSGMGIEIVFAGQKYFINSNRMQIIDLLLSTYENAIQKNDELARANQELMAMHRELAKKNTQLEKLNEEKNKFLGMAAHDLRNPLSTIKGFSEYILEETEEVLTSRHIEFLNIIMSSSEFMLQLVNDLLDISQIESGKLELNKKPTDITKFIAKNISLNKYWAERKHINLEFIQAEKIPEVIMDDQKMDQVLNNLISNAIKYSPSNTTIQVKLENKNDRVLISVQDEGQGIPEAELDKLFKPFSKTSVKSTAGEKSTGLGLVIARKIVDGHNGKIWVESKVGKGSTFYVEVPIGLA
jgi:signal transduction histidine kinase